jgi:hypothetical protein
LWENPIGEACKDALRLDIDRRVKVEFHGTKVTSNAGLLAHLERFNLSKVSNIEKNNGVSFLLCNKLVAV